MVLGLIRKFFKRTGILIGDRMLTSLLCILKSQAINARIKKISFILIAYQLEFLDEQYEFCVFSSPLD